MPDENSHCIHRLPAGRWASRSELRAEPVFGLSWALSEQPRHFELGHILNSVVTDSVHPDQVGAIGSYHAGLWECDLTDQSLIWSGGVYDIFGLERGARITRMDALGHYTEDSRVKLERLRAYAIRHAVGFTIDVEIRSAAVGQTRSVRVIGVAQYEGATSACLHGLKLIV